MAELFAPEDKTVQQTGCVGLPTSLPTGESSHSGERAVICLWHRMTTAFDDDSSERVYIILSTRHCARPREKVSGQYCYIQVTFWMGVSAHLRPKQHNQLEAVPACFGFRFMGRRSAHVCLTPLVLGWLQFAALPRPAWAMRRTLRCPAGRRRLPHRQRASGR